MQYVLTTNSLSKRFGKIQAVDNLSLHVEEGSVYGILGPNGSGKSTTLGMLLGIINPDKGDFSWFGKPASKKSRQQIGAMLEQPNFYPYLSAYQNLKIVCQIKELPFDSIDDTLRRVNLFERRKSQFKTFSTGMKQRLAIAATLLGNPHLLVLDEPTNGLDPQGIAEVRELIVKIAQEGKTIILASHILDEVEKVCTHTAVIKSGKLLAEGSVDEIVKGENLVEVAAEDMDLLRSVLEHQEFITKVKREKDIFLVLLTDEMNATSLNKHLFRENIILSHLKPRKKKLEEQFLELTSS